jgi:hypothetical protein
MRWYVAPQIPVPAGLPHIACPGSARRTIRGRLVVQLVLRGRREHLTEDLVQPLA